MRSILTPSESEFRKGMGHFATALVRDLLEESISMGDIENAVNSLNKLLDSRLAELDEEYEESKKC